MSDEAVQVLGGLLAAALFRNIALSVLSRRKQKEYVGKVSRLFVYPVKSARELPATTSVELTKHGVKFGEVADRHWMVTMANGNPYTLLQSTLMTSIRPSTNGNELILSAEGHPSVAVPVDPVMKEGDVKAINCSNTPIEVVDCGDKAAAWLCKVLQREGLRLSYAVPSLTKRPSCKVKKDWPTKIHPEDEVAFQAFVHCLVMCESSLDELNQRLPSPVSVICFRPNLMIEGTNPFDEDNWEKVFLGNEAQLRYVDHCSRCSEPNIDPNTGIKSKDGQPLKELKKFRCMEPYSPKPCMGVHMCVAREGTVKVGDPVYVIRK